MIGLLDPFRMCLALGPVAVYLLLLGCINLSKHPRLVSGTRDVAALGLAVSGFILVGPVELCFPNAAAARFGPYVWVLLTAFYGLCLVLVLLLLRPRLVIYNISAEQLRPVLADVVSQLDGDARWAGESLFLPALGIQLHVEGPTDVRNASLTSLGTKQSQAGWRRLELSLGSALGRIEVGRNRRGAGLLTTGVLITSILVAAVARDPDGVGKAFLDMLRI